MNKKLIIQGAILPIFLTLSAQSFAISPKTNEPAACPSPKVIQSTGLDRAVLGGTSPDENWMVGKENANYGTPDEWTYVMFVSADNKEAALAKGEKIMETLSIEKGPTDLRPFIEGWGCLYANSGHHLAMAITPPVAFPTDIRPMAVRFK